MKECFVIAPIGEAGSQTRSRSDKVLKHIIRPAVAECGYKAVRADEIDEIGFITSHVIRRIIEAPLLVADLTGHNPNVFYELAIRHSQQKPLVQLIDVGQPIPFDIAGMRTIHIDHLNPTSIKKAKQEIISQVRKIDQGMSKLETPISAAMGSKRDSARSYRTWSLIDKEGFSGDRRDGYKIEGERLFRHEGYYPIDIAPETNIPSLNPEVFLKAIGHFLKKDNYDRHAAMDLVYLREDNIVDVGDILDKVNMPLYESLIERYDLLDFIRNFPKEKETIFRNFVRIVEDVGDTLKDVCFEILLHDVRNPIRSIVAARNSESLSGRKKGDPSTRFVVQYVKNQGKRFIQAMEGGSKVSYLKQFNRIKQVKATTTPIYHEEYGLIGILCLNIDIDSILRLDKKGRDTFFGNYIKNSGHTPRFERED